MSVVFMNLGIFLLVSAAVLGLVAGLRSDGADCGDAHHGHGHGHGHH